MAGWISRGTFLAVIEAEEQAPRIIGGMTTTREGVYGEAGFHQSAKISV